MLPVTRANLDHICCICLQDIRPSMFSQKVYDVKKEKNMSKVLKLTAHITVLKNPINQKYINDYCRKICEICFLKTQYSYFFREKIMASTASLKELLEGNEMNDLDIERLQYFCRICLNRQNGIKNLNMKYLNWLKDCSGIRFTSLVDSEIFRIKEGTNINEIAVIDDTKFPQQLCANCLKKLQNVEEFRKSSTQSFEYMISVMGDVSGPEEDDLVTQEIKQFKKNVIWKQVPPAQPLLVNETSVKQDCAIWHVDNNKSEEAQQENFSTEALQCQMQITYDSLEPFVEASDYSNSLQLANDGLEHVMDFIEDLPHYSNDDDDDNNDDDNKDFILNFSNDEISSADCSDITDKNKPLGMARARKLKQCNKNNSNLSIKEEIVESENCEAKPKRRKKGKETQKGETQCCNYENRARKAKQPKESVVTSKIDNVEERIICEKCSKEFANISKLKRHQRTVHSSNQMMHRCPICSKEFKRKSHLVDHVKTVHEKQRPFKCSQCTKYFSTNSSKNAHELTHTDEFPFVCEWCKKGFRRSYRLKVHLERHTTKAALLCPICKRSQKSTKDLEDHLKGHDDKRLQCPSCGKLFSRSSHLKDHYNAIHLKLRPFKCDFCDLAFGDRKTRRQHEKSHTEERPITCTVCKRGFKNSSSFKRHINVSGHAVEESKSKDKKSKKKSSKILNLRYTENLNGIFELGTHYL